VVSKSLLKARLMVIVGSVCGEFRCLLYVSTLSSHVISNFCFSLTAHVNAIGLPVFHHLTWKVGYRFRIGC